MASLGLWLSDYPIHLHSLQQILVFWGVKLILNSKIKRRKLSYLRQATSRICLERLKKNMEIFSRNSKFHSQISKLAACTYKVNTLFWTKQAYTIYVLHSINSFYALYLLTICYIAIYVYCYIWRKLEFCVFLDLRYICRKQVLLRSVPYLSHKAPVFQPPGSVAKGN